MRGYTTIVQRYSFGNTVVHHTAHIFHTSIEVVYQPLGVVVGITPWNFPLVIGILKLASPIIFGNTVVVKVGRCMLDMPNCAGRSWLLYTKLRRS